MAGRRYRGNALAAGVNVLSGAVQTDIQRQFDTESEGRKFRQKLVELGIEGKIPGFEADPAALQGMMTGQGFQGPPLRRTDPSQQLAGLSTQLQALKPYIDSGVIDLKGDINLGGGFRASLRSPKQLDLKEQLFSDIRGAGEEVARLQTQSVPQINRIQASQPMGFGVSEQVMPERSSAINRSAGLVQQPLLQARNRLGQLQGQARLLNESGLLSTPGLVAEGGSQVDPQTQSVIEDLQNGRATPQEFLAQEAELQAAGVDTEAIRRQLGL